MVRYRLITVALIILIFGGVGALLSRLGLIKIPICEAFNRSNLIRLRVIANSDSPEDQAIKLKVRDRVLKVSESFMKNAKDSQTVDAILRDKLDVLADVARAELVKYYKNTAVKVQIGEFPFTGKKPVVASVDTNRYKGLWVVIGEGRGHNWLGVMYPPLGLLSSDAPAPKKKVKNQKVKVEYRLAVLEKMVKKKDLTMNRFWVKWGKQLGMLR